MVCPTDHLRTQWADAADALGLPLDAALSNAVGPVRPDLRGYVTTYAQVAAKPALHAARAAARRSLVILDEVHHAGDGLSWGDAVATAFDQAARRLCLTGTPFRTRPDERIPFVRYEAEPDGGWRSAADFTYGYRDALRDGVVRPVVFAAYTGTSRWRNSAGEVIAASLSESGTKRTEATAWRTALNPKGKWVPHVIAAMDERITHLRASGMPDAAGLVLASDQDDARSYAEIVEQVTGEAPVLILSDDPNASAKITAFTHGTQRMAVCVRMVSEGVDVPRAACLAWMTSYRTPLFFAQGVGRVVRARGRSRGGDGVPARRPAAARARRRARGGAQPRHPAARRPGRGAAGRRAARDRSPARRDQFELVDADASFAHLLHAGRAVVAAPERAHRRGRGLPRAARHPVARNRRRRCSPAATPPRAGGPPARSPRPHRPTPPPAWRAGPNCAREVNRLVGVLAARTGRAARPDPRRAAARWFPGRRPPRPASRSSSSAATA